MYFTEKIHYQGQIYHVAQRQRCSKQNIFLVYILSRDKKMGQKSLAFVFHFFRAKSATSAAQCKSDPAQTDIPRHL